MSDAVVVVETVVGGVGAMGVVAFFRFSDLGLFGFGVCSRSALGVVEASIFVVVEVVEVGWLVGACDANHSFFLFVPLEINVL